MLCYKYKYSEVLTKKNKKKNKEKHLNISKNRFDL